MKYTPGLMVGQLSGKAGSTVASRNRSGSYFRTRNIPKLVQNAATTAVRNNFTVNSQAYREIEEAQRAAWAALGASIVRKNSLGTAFHLTGLQAFQSVNRNLTALGLSSVADAPFFDAAEGLTSITPTVAAGSPETTAITTGANSATQLVTSSADMYVGAVVLEVQLNQYRTVVSIPDATHVIFDSPLNTTTADDLTWLSVPTFDVVYTPDPVPANTRVVVFVTAPLSAGISRPGSSQYRQIDTLAPGDSSPLDLGALYGARFGSPQPGQKVFVKFRFVSFNGISGQEIVNFALVG